MKASQIKQWCRKAYKRAHGFGRITIAANGVIHGHYEPKAALPVNLGSIHNCWTSAEPDGTIRFYNHGKLIHRFAKTEEVTP